MSLEPPVPGQLFQIARDSVRGFLLRISAIILQTVHVGVVADEIASTFACREIRPASRFHVDLERAELAIVTVRIEREELIALELALYPIREQDFRMSKCVHRDLLY